MYYSAHYHSPLGPITIASTDSALVGLWFDGQKNFLGTLDGENLRELSELEVLRTTSRWLDIYFSGGIPCFTPPLLLLGSKFRQRVWQELLLIPYGKTRSYAEIARQIGCKSAQAIGGAVGHNNISLIIPCHRVIGSNGELTGYAGGIERKRQLLNIEQGV